MKTLSTEKQGEMVLFMNVPVGAEIRFNGCRCIKLDAKHVKFLSDCDGKPTDYSKSYNKRYARCTQVCIEGTPCWILKLPTVRATKCKPAKLIAQADALISEAKRLTKDALVIEELHAANLHLSDAEAILSR